MLPLNPHEKGPKNLIQQTEYKLKSGIVRNGGADKEGAEIQQKQLMVSSDIAGFKLRFWLPSSGDGIALSPYTTC